jgi:hypothetical protein
MTATQCIHCICMQMQDVLICECICLPPTHPPLHTRTGILTVQLLNLNWEALRLLQQHVKMSYNSTCYPPTANSSVPTRCYQHAHVCPGVRTYAHVCMAHRWYHQVILHLDLAEVRCLLWAQLDYLLEKAHALSPIQPILVIQLTVLRLPCTLTLIHLRHNGWPTMTHRGSDSVFYSLICLKE